MKNLLNKKDYFLLLFLGLIILIPTLIFQRVPGYMDSEYYFLGGSQLAKGSLNLPVIWNYLDNLEKLPYPLFTYWMPFPSIITFISMSLFASTKFLYGRLLFWLLAAAIAPFTAYISFRLSGNRFVAWIAGLLALFNGFYYKYSTIPETITPYILLGGIFLLFSSILLESYNNKKTWILILCLGFVAGLLHMTRVDGIIFLFLGLTIMIYLQFCEPKIVKPGFSKFLIFISIYFLGYLLITGWWFGRNYLLFNSLFSPASSHALWISSYDDTFIFPASTLNLQYWLDYGLAIKPGQIWDAIKINIQTLIAVQSNIFGLPLLIFGIIKLKRKSLIVIASILWVIFFILMTFVFSLAGARGGFLHSSASLQIIQWCLIAEGLFLFIQWGIKNRHWKLLRSEIMFGSALIVFAIIFSSIIFFRDVIGTNSGYYKWETETIKFSEIEKFISLNSNSNREVVMINNPVGYYYQTNRWSIVLPNSSYEEFPDLISKYDVRYIVIDNNLPEKLTDFREFEEFLGLRIIKQFTDGRIIYAVQ